MIVTGVNMRAVILILAIFVISGCTNVSEFGSQPLESDTKIPTRFPTSTPTTLVEETSTFDTPPSTTDFDYDAFAFPAEIDPSGRYMFYLHGKIIEDQGIPAISPEHGEYKYSEILLTLQNHGFVVISEQRSKDTHSTIYAQRVAGQVNDLLGFGVPAESIIVVGASKGAIIAAIVSKLLRNPEVNYVFLGACYSPFIEDWKQQGLSLSGNVLAIYDADDRDVSSCEELFTFSNPDLLGRHDEIVLHVGTGHGILYEPLPEWVIPTVKWGIKCSE